MQRSTENGTIDGFLAQATSGPAVLAITGPAGIGKTTILLDALDRARGLGFHVLLAHGSVTEVSYAYAAIADLLSDIDDELIATLPKPHRQALRWAIVGDADPTSIADEQILASTFRSLIEHCQTQAPVLLAVDDAQWLDPSSRAVVSYLARRLDGRVGLLLSFRDDETTDGYDRSWLQPPRPQAGSVMHVPPLDLNEVHDMLASRLGHPLPRPTVLKIHEISGGNPFFAVELAATASASPSFKMPRALAALVRSKINDLDEEVTQILLAAACATFPTVELLSVATGLSPHRTVELIESIARHDIVELTGNQVGFTHPLFAAGIYSGASGAQRRAMHRALAELVTSAELRARHLALAAVTEDPETLAALDAAAHATAVRGAPAAAAELIELALRLDGNSAHRRVRAGELHFRAGALTAARAHLQAAISDLPSGQHRSLALMCLSAVQAHDDFENATATLSAAADEAGDNAVVRLMCLIGLSMLLLVGDHLQDALDCAEKAVAIADQLGIPDLRSRARTIWLVNRYLCGLGIDHEVFNEALELQNPNSDAQMGFSATANQALMSSWAGDVEAAHRQMLALAQQMSNGSTEADIVWFHTHFVPILVRLGRNPEATEAAREAVLRAEQLGGKLPLATAWTAQAIAAAHRGDQNEARDAAGRAIDTAHQIGATFLAKEPTAALAFLEVSLGNYTAALDVLKPLLDWFDPVRTVEMETGCWLPDAIEALTSTDRYPEAEPLVCALELAGAERGRAWMLAVGARGRGQLLAARNELAAAEQAVQQALNHHAQLHLPFELARTQLLLGQLQRRLRRRQLAAGTLQKALSTFEQIGTPVWAARTRAELGRLAGSAVPAGGLAATEYRIAQLAVQGLSNKQIAAAEFVSPKTVEAVLSSVYRKLGIRSRTQLHTRLLEF